MSVSQTHITRSARSTTGRAAGQTPARPARPAGRTSALAPAQAPAPARLAGQAGGLVAGQPASLAAGQVPATVSGRPVPVGGVGLTRDQVMTATEVAELLALPVSTVYYLARQGRLPASRLGRAYRFLRPALERLLEDGGW